jgi:hypothetical protein
MKIAINWFEVTLPSIEFVVPVQTLGQDALSESNRSKKPRFAHRVVQRKDAGRIRLLHITNSAPPDTTLETITALDDPGFTKLVIEEAFANRLLHQGFAVIRKHVEHSAYQNTTESSFVDVYTFLRGLEFRSFYLAGRTGLRWGVVLNYITSQQFAQTLASPELSKFAIGKRVTRLTTGQSKVGEDATRVKSTGLLVSVANDVALIDIGDDVTLEENPEDWTLICRRELLVDYVEQQKGRNAATELTRKLQQASFSLTESGRMNTRLSRNQIEAIQKLIKECELDRLTLPLPDSPLATLSSQPFAIGE